MPITEVTRRGIFDELALSRSSWAGRLAEHDFLARLYPMDDLPSHDRRFKDAHGDVWQHRFNNHDWPDDWVFYDERFELLQGPDDVLLRFLCESVHPIVRSDGDTVAALVEMFNRHLRVDGYELHPTGDISGHPVYRARSLLQGSSAVGLLLSAAPLQVDASYISQQVTRMESAINTDPDLAIGTAKELVETVAKTILDELGVPYGNRDDLVQLVKEARKALELVPDSLPGKSDAADTIRRLLSNLGDIVQGLSSLRNWYGTGHGRTATSDGLQARHARLAAGAAATLTTFMFETHQSALDSQSSGSENSVRDSRLPDGSRSMHRPSTERED